MRPGHRLTGRYRLVERLDGGAADHVWRAWDEVLRRPVAVKLPAAGRPATAERHRLLRERVVRAVRVPHPAFVTVYDCHMSRTADGRPASYIVTAFLGQESLAGRVAREPLTVPEALDCCAQVAAALAAAHAAGVAHGDLRPEKIFHTRDGVRIADLGLAEGDAAGDMAALGAVLDACLPAHGPDHGEVPEEVAGLARRCRSPDPAERPDAGTAAGILARAQRAQDAAVPGPGAAVPGDAPEAFTAPVGPPGGAPPGAPGGAHGAAPGDSPDRDPPTLVHEPVAADAPQEGAAGRGSGETGIPAMHVAVAAAVLAVALVMLVLANREAPGPSARPGGAVPSSPAPSQAGPAEPVSVPAAYATLDRLQPIIDGARAAGDIRSDVAVDLNNQITNLRNDLAAGRTEGIGRELARIREKIETRLRERALDQEVAARMNAVLSEPR